jgi:hypothetical protein
LINPDLFTQFGNIGPIINIANINNHHYEYIREFTSMHVSAIDLSSITEETIITSGSENSGSFNDLDQTNIITPIPEYRCFNNQQIDQTIPNNIHISADSIQQPSAWVRYQTQVEPVENLIDEDQELILRFGTVGSKAYKFVNNILKRFF